MQSSLRDAVRVCIRNPFRTDSQAWQRAANRIRRADLLAALELLLRRADTAPAQKLLLAIGHLQACRHPHDPRLVLSSNTLPPRLARRLPAPLPVYLRIAMAAGRCHERLTSFQGASPALRKVRCDVWAACFGESLFHTLALERVIMDHDVLILGETGTGKEAIAHAVQDGTLGPSDGRCAPRAALNAAAVPHTLIESELFGHVKGAFTGASSPRTGKIRSASGGCFFLDEVGDLDSTTQVKLLRVMETDEVSPLGSDVSHEVDVRYVAATHRDLALLVEQRRFRRDLFQRLAGCIIHLPSLRERPEDIPEIGLRFVDAYRSPSASAGGGSGQPPVSLPRRNRIERWLRSAEAQRHTWPGNVRELQNALRNLLLGRDPGLSSAASKVDPVPSEDQLPRSLRDCSATLQQASDWYLQRVLAHTGDNFARAARTLAMDRATVRRRARRSLLPLPTG